MEFFVVVTTAIKKNWVDRPTASKPIFIFGLTSLK
jgi:hypothetical protein